METRTAVYRMNPAEDRIIFGDDLEEGMWVLAESPHQRTPYVKNEDEDEDGRLRAQRFRQVTRLRITLRMGATQTVFVGEWVDGYQAVHVFDVQAAWLVKNTREEADMGGFPYPYYMVVSRMLNDPSQEEDVRADAAARLGPEYEVHEPAVEEEVPDAAA